MFSDPTGTAIYYGLPLGEGTKLLTWASSRRFEEIKHKLPRIPDDGTECGYIYDSSRCHPENVGDRFAGTFRSHKGLTLARQLWTAIKILAGWYDEGIEDTWHERANAAAWYARGKEW